MRNIIALLLALMLTLSVVALPATAETTPEGTVHFNIPYFRNGPASGNVHPDYADFVEVIVTTADKMTTGTTFNHTGETIVAANQTTEWHSSSGGSYVIVTVEKTTEGQEMKFELIQATTGKVLDTYIIKKSN